MGTHAELLRQRGHYYRLYTQQFQYGFSEAVGADGKKEAQETLAAD
jgi:hypothetical protein